MDKTSTSAKMKSFVVLGFSGLVGAAIGLASAQAQQCPPNCTGGPGQDIIIGNASGNNMDGRGADDFLQGNAGNDDEFGGDDDDSIEGGFDNDDLRGEDGFDNSGGVVIDGVTFKLPELFGEGGNDDLQGGEGGDGTDAGAGADTTDGGNDNDGLQANNDDNDSDTVDGGPGNNDACAKSTQPEPDNFLRCEHMFQGNP